MKNFARILILSFAFVFCFVAVQQAQGSATNVFEGYFILLNAVNGSCSVTYASPYTYTGVPTAPVYRELVITDLNSATTLNIVACPGTNTQVISVNTTTGIAKIRPDSTTGQFCFKGEDTSYDISFSDALNVTSPPAPPTQTPNVTYRWVAKNSNTGFYNVKDFGAKGDGTTDDTQAFKSALAYIATRYGGTLYVPDGDFIVSGSGITIPSGATIQGASPMASLNAAGYNIQKSASRIRIKNANETIFKIGECAERITIRDIELFADSGSGTTGIKAQGSTDNNSSQNFLFENVSFTQMDFGIDVLASPAGGFWQFDYVKVRDCRFTLNRTAGVRIDAFDSDWDFDHCLFHLYTRSGSNRGDGIYVVRSSSVQVTNSFAGSSGTSVGGDFIYADRPGPITVINSATEKLTSTFVLNPATAPVVERGYAYPITFINNVFGDKIDLLFRAALVSTGNLYGPATFSGTTSSSIRVYSTGDRFCYDIATLGTCTPSVNTLANPPFGGSTVVFQTGQPRDRDVSTGNPLGNSFSIPTTFGHEIFVSSDDGDTPLVTSQSYNFNRPLLRLGQNYYFDFKRSGANGFLEITGSQGIPYRGVTLNAVLQLDPNTTYSNLTSYATALGTDNLPVLKDGALLYCKDCQPDPTGTPAGVCKQVTSGGGALAKRINGAWMCN